MSVDSLAPLLISPNVINLARTNSHIAHAHFTKTDKQPKSQQSTAVRQLLTWTLNKQRLSATLVEKQFPYFLQSSTPNIQNHFVCFSHSENQVALIISPYPAAIDIELRAIPMQVAQRFFHDNEYAFLHALHAENPKKAQQLIRLLWQLKECWIKLHQLTLTAGMGIDFSHLVASLLTQPTDKSLLFSQDNHLYAVDITADFLLSLVQLDKAL